MSYVHSANSTRMHIARVTGPQTMMLWVRFNAIGASFGNVIQAHGSMQIQLEDSGSSVYFVTYWNGTSDVRGPTIRLKRWYHFAMSLSGDTNGNTFKIYLNGLPILSGTIADTGGGDLGLDLEVMNDSALEWCNGLWEGIKVWKFQMTRAQIVREMQQLAPVTMAKIHSCVYGRSITDLKNRGGTGGAWTTSGATLATGTLSPRSYGVFPTDDDYQFVAAPAGGAVYGFRSLLGVGS